MIANSLQKIFKVRSGSNICHKITHANAKRPSNLHKRSERDLHIPPLDLANKVMMQIGLFSQLFLSKSSLLATRTDRLAQNSTVMRS